MALISADDDDDNNNDAAPHNKRSRQCFRL